MNTTAEQDTSAVRRAALAHTDLLLGWAPAERPEHIAPSRDPHIVAIAPRVARRLADLVPPLWMGPHDAATYRANLLGWTASVGHDIWHSSRANVLLARLGEADADRIDGMEAWLDGQWADRVALVELLWRIEVGPNAVAAALWLHDQARG